MSYETALGRSWDDLRTKAGEEVVSVRFLDEFYAVDPGKASIIGASGRPVKDFVKILILHYLAGMKEGKYVPSGEAVSFKDMEGGEIYYPAFRTGAIAPIIKKYGTAPKSMIRCLERLKGRELKEGDAAVEIYPFDDVAVKVVVWGADDELPAEATMLFDRNIANLLPTEDIAVLARLIAFSL